MTETAISKSKIGIFLEDRDRSGEINLQDKLSIGEFNSNRVDEMSVEAFLKNSQRFLPGLTPAGRLNLLKKSLGGLLTRPNGAPPRLKLGDDVQKAAADLETDAEFAAERDGLSRDLSFLNREWDKYFSDLDRAGRETPELKLRGARLQARTVALNRRVDGLGFREGRESLVRKLEQSFGWDLDNRTLRITKTGDRLMIYARDARDRSRHRCVEINPRGEVWVGWRRMGDKSRCSTDFSDPIAMPEGEAFFREAQDSMQMGPF